MNADDQLAKTGDLSGNLTRKPSGKLPGNLSGKLSRHLPGPPSSLIIENENGTISITAGDVIHLRKL